MRAGEHFLVTCGEYSDFGIYASLLALRDFDFDAELSAWLAAHPAQAVEYRFCEEAFLRSLVDRGPVQTAPLLRLHLANYSTAEPAPEKTARKNVRRRARGGLT